MIGALWAVAAGIGFGVFQTVNRRAVRDLDVYIATFVQLVVSAFVLIIISLATQDLNLLYNAPATAWLYFGLAGFVHFFIGWTFLNASQKQVGAARTSSLIATIPLFGIALAAATLGELPSWLMIGGMGVIIGGVYLVNQARIQQNEATAKLPTGWRSLIAGLMAALCWSVSPIFIRFGLAELAAPILGLTVGISASVLGYGVVVFVRRLKTIPVRFPTEALVIKVIAGVLAALATWAYWVAFDLASVALVLTLSLLSVPTVNLLSPWLVGRELEQVTAQVWLGSGLIIGGSVLLIFLR